MMLTMLSSSWIVSNIIYPFCITNIISDPCALLLTPRSEPLVVTDQIRTKIGKFLATTLEIDGNQAKRLIPNTLKQWGRVRISNGGDLIHVHGYHKLHLDGRDASFVRVREPQFHLRSVCSLIEMKYELLVDRNASQRNVLVELHQVSHYGRLEHLLVLPLEPHTLLNGSNVPWTLLLALILETKPVVEHTHHYTVVWYDGTLGSGEVVDARTIQCSVGRVRDDNRFWIIDRSAECELTFPTFD
jgi:hypothetical protein